jgi:hypothetical protein
MSKEEMMEELRRRVDILEWMRSNNIRAFKDVARAVASYSEVPGEFMEKIRKETQSAQSSPASSEPEVIAGEHDVLESDEEPAEYSKTDRKPLKHLKQKKEKIKNYEEEAP